MKTKIQLLAFALILSCFPMMSQAAEKTMSREQAEARISSIQQRVSEIKAMDVENMSRMERKEVKQELRGMNKELRALDPVIYISAGALIIIILLLILLL